MNTHNPWKTLDTKTVHESPWIKVDHHKVINPGGFDSFYSTIHFKNLAIGVIPIDEDMNTYLVGQFRYPIEEYSWEIPEGGGDRNIDPIESASRELQEETGITAKEYRHLVTSHISNSATDEKAIIFMARNLEFGDANPEDDEELQCKKVSLAQLFKMVESGEITDSLTIMAAQKIELMLLKGEL